MTIRERLKEAWEIASSYRGDSYVVAAHAFVCHGDGSDCDGGSTCRPYRENLQMLEAAGSIVEASPHGDVEDLVRLWAARLTVGDAT